ncbi:hypothetical protein SAMN05428642_1115 [Flaviramulus basaltis]|uniref:Uncharacterized protein n=1 Tax=Flaviramulus basaltis TaxID=369401 RepID=A0A1K2IRV1_9FLAO|nr:hypothetical protein [Flaviramulus basaltis]SFZ95188.1 hypothetical protein SAMN05428642_1115 [Flaviramulus basaltis]
MKFINLIIILLLTFSCSNEKETAEFEKVLGKENSETLTYLVNDFESDFLKRQYPNLETKKAYKQFLTELSKGQTEYWKKISESSREYLEKSNLRLEIYSVPDSIWIERDPEKLTLGNSSIPMLKIKRKYLMPDGTFEYSTSESSFRYKEPIDEDSIIESHKNWIDINYVGSYSRALNSISDKSDFLIDYLDIRETAGTIDPRIIADRMLKSKVNLNDYFIKRIIITEIVY